jgi:hypothetical protein
LQRGNPPCLLRTIAMERITGVAFFGKTLTTTTTM